MRASGSTPSRGDPTDNAASRLNPPVYAPKPLNVELLDEPTSDPLFDYPPMTAMTPPLYSRGCVGG